MKYENLLASRYIKAQKRQSAFTTISIAAAVAVITMIFILYSVCMNCLGNVFYSSAPYHLLFSELTEEQGEAMGDFDEVRSVKLESHKEGVSAYVMFGSDIGDRELWLMNAAKKIGAEEKYQRSSHSSMHGAYEWNDNLMKMDGVYDGAHLVKLRIFCIFFIFAVLIAFALRMIIDTAFEVSSKERERHYGVLQSIGATPEQIVRIITQEGLRLCAVGVPFGLIAGTGFAYLMYNVLLKAGLSEIFQGMTNAKLYLPFTVDWRMLLVSAVIGVVWVFLSAYGVGMRVIKKTPMEAITTRADKVEKIKKRTLSGLLFGISGSIASRNARRQKKRFAITVLTLTVSITMFALFSSLTETVERSALTYLRCIFDEDMDFDFTAEIRNNHEVKFEDNVQQLADSGLFKDIGVEVMAYYSLEGSKQRRMVHYLNREAYEQHFGSSAPVSYDELVRTGGYVLNQGTGDAQAVAEAISSNHTLQIKTARVTLPAGMDSFETDWNEIVKACEFDEPQSHEVTVLGNVNRERVAATMYGAIETYKEIADEWYGDPIFGASAVFSYNGKGDYNAADHKKTSDWFMEHSDTIRLGTDLYEIKWKIQNVMASVRAGVLMLNILLALAALINLMNIISTGIANRRSELASLQCVGMTDKQLDRMAIIECLQFAGAAAIISALVCALVIFGIESGLTALIKVSFDNETEAEREMLLNMVRIDHITPFVRIGLGALAAFAAGCVTSLVMLRTQNNESLSDQIRGSEMKLDTKKSHLLRNSILVIAGAFVLTIAGLRTYSVLAYRHDRNEYAKAGYLNLVDGADKKINVYSTGAEHGKHTIVGISGQGVTCFPIITEALNERLGKENTMVYPDRAGYGFSDDTLKNQTLKQVVEDYRAGLKNAGFTAPYVLMPHSLGSFYALWWQANYPDEIEAIVFLDCTWVPKNNRWFGWSVDEFHTEAAAYASARRVGIRTWLGLDRLDRLMHADKNKEKNDSYGKSVLTKEQLDLFKLTQHRDYTAAAISEAMNEPEYANELRRILKPTDIPKLYFSTEYSCEEDIREYLEFQKADYEAAGLEFKLDPETAAKSQWQREQWECQDFYANTLTPFLEQCGNCRLVTIGGEHGIFYAQKPDQVADEISALLEEIK